MLKQVLTLRRLVNVGAEPCIADLLPRASNVEYLKFCTVLCYHKEKLVGPEARNLQNSQLTASC